jgi:hypothetical protein
VAKEGKVVVIKFFLACKATEEFLVSFNSASAVIIFFSASVFVV